VPPLVIGDRTEVHAAAVVGEISKRGIDPVVFDTRSLVTSRWRWWDGELEVLRGKRWEIVGTGWIRRLAPPGALEGLAVGSRLAAEHSARLALVSALSNTTIKWLSSYWSVLHGENKLVQYAHAKALGIRFPMTTVVANAADIARDLGEEFVVKPLGPGQFVDQGQYFAVHSKVRSRSSNELEYLAAAPFLLQTRVFAASHLRVVTVFDRAWVAELGAEGVPLDWRESERAHESWKVGSWPTVEVQARALARELRLGYSSQDWIVDTIGDAWFIDANPSGQWLFLPDAIAESVTLAIADFLSG
jgi:hypothetical protein